MPVRAPIDSNAYPLRSFPCPSARLFIALIAVALAVLALPALAAAAPKPAVLNFKTVTVGAPGNPSVGIVPFTDAIYRSVRRRPAAQEAA